MSVDIIKPIDPEFSDTPPEILNDRRYMPHFKDCICAINGTHVRASIAPEKQIPYIGRKGILTQNIMAACSFDIQFTFVWAGWEGTAHDARIFLVAINDPVIKFPKSLECYLKPYKDTRHHLPDFRRGQPPSGQEEIFNRAHSSLGSVIERTFGVWKNR
ncbi:hypothetical protein P3X46_000580 [Hevea brasiliensis]|uniref:DDE Tnp4 domain-containing protein n=1 Tax=Hevea brasiliensis TaxID=3981 RepID=A0ABQ9NDF9_HEVBR|nr:hypothetical protein P3X46_000580 [Hevea brasiliensis]